jgi:soluble lytic murein transglycosylase-like protein
MKKTIIAFTLCMLTSLACRAECWNEAGARYNIDPALLQAIAQVESGLNANARNHNKDGSYDVGLMQINNRHLPRLASYGITEKRLLSEPCTSVMVGAWILAGFVQRVGYNWNAVGAYNAGTGKNRQGARERYIAKVATQYRAFIMPVRHQAAVRTTVPPASQASNSP